MIQMRISEEAKLYNPLDPEQERISDEVFTYLKSYCSESEIRNHTFDKLQIISDTPVDELRFRKMLRQAVQKDQEAFDLQIATNNRRAVWEYIVGIGLSLAGALLSISLDKILLAMISFFGTMILREAVMIGTKINPDIRRLKKRLEPLMSCEIEVLGPDRNRI